MKKVQKNEDWYLMCPDECPGLCEAYGDKFEELYNQYVEESRYKKSMPARTLWANILKAQSETGIPYLVYKDAVNKKSNQKNV